MGVDVIQLQDGVMGPRGFVPLDEPELFCSAECLHDEDEPEYTLPRRIP